MQRLGKKKQAKGTRNRKTVKFAPNYFGSTHSASMFSDRI